MAHSRFEGSSFFEGVEKDLLEFGAHLENFSQLLAGLNERARLTGPREAFVIMEEHIRDCAFSLVFAPDIGSVVDVGTGGGLPGVVWAVCRPKLRVTLLESVGKKCSVLEEISYRLRLSNVDIACSRSEALALERRESYGIALSRAVGHLGVVAEYISPLVRVGGFGLVFKGPKVEQELEDVGSDWPVLGFKDPVIYPYSLNGKSLCIVKLEKQKPCPARFPRNPGKANKNFWWRCPR
ncbi:MAG: 16S rRNA (guanine(527)-N(7))-methyltransferase RsmG [Thermovirgaceae bacterium]|nr:16S rRNA (guanine(527)-N(7))-methyltransferase RsmG [Thermovirgaceae bacterium]